VSRGSQQSEVVVHIEPHEKHSLEKLGKQLGISVEEMFRQGINLWFMVKEINFKGSSDTYKIKSTDVTTKRVDLK